MFGCTSMYVGEGEKDFGYRDCLQNIRCLSMIVQ